MPRRPTPQLYPQAPGRTPPVPPIPAERARRARLPAALDAVLDGLFPAQRAFVLSEARKLATCTGRRGGKTHAVTARAVRAAHRYPRTTIPVFERTLTCASSRIMWRALQDLNDRYALGVRFHHSLYIASLTNGSEIIIVGADTAEAADKARGGAYPEAIIDEAGTFRPHILEYLLNDVLKAALFDHGGTLVMSGTPVAHMMGPFYEACHPKLDAAAADLYELHHWTVLDNPNIPFDRPPPAEPFTTEGRAAQRLADLLRELGVASWDVRQTAEPWKRREWLGEWVAGDGRMAYRVGAHNVVNLRDTPADLRSNPERYVWGLGLDLGFNDPTAFVVVARSRADGRLWVVESYEQSGLIPSAVAAHVERLRQRYPFAYIVADTGGYGKGPAAEMASARWGIPVISANKRGKEAHRTFMNGDLASGRLLILETANRDLIHDLAALRLDENGDEDERDANHLPDALLYIVTHLATVERGMGEPDAAVKGSPAWYAALEASMERLAVAELAGGTDDGLSQLPYR